MMEREADTEKKDAAFRASLRISKVFIEVSEIFIFILIFIFDQAAKKN